MPGLIGSLLLIIVGAITKFAYSEAIWTWTSGGKNHSLQVDTVGTILLIAGVIALVLSMAYAFLDRTKYVEEEVVYEEPDVLPRSRKVNKTNEKDNDVPLLPKPARPRRRTKSE